ncbi:unnamed protein product [Cuscuta campestris]|uniref:Syntaxin N-terminal domain-containing protein n=1 Tax=Cuscuta campestris TaxID=132261 RepID=A0A484N3G2_9ASTE|nr:unnamed protein product [Cuscuta campestris]
MSSTLLEVTRASHEEIERLERVIVKDLQTEPATNKDRLYQSHRVRNVIERIIDTTHRLTREYHRRNLGARVLDTSDEYEQLLKHEQPITFSGEVSAFTILAIICACICIWMTCGSTSVPKSFRE